MTDLDKIERSNLSRQLLFGDSDIGSFKSSTAAARLRALPHAPGFSISPHTCPVSSPSLSSQFWSSATHLLTALDNVPARVFCSRRAVSNSLPHVDSGTSGARGSVQAVVPGVTEAYHDVADAPVEETPVCTIKQFP